MPNNQMEIKDPGETLGRGSGPGMRAGRHTEAEKDPKKYMGFNFPERFHTRPQACRNPQGHDSHAVRHGHHAP